MGEIGAAEVMSDRAKVLSERIDKGYQAVIERVRQCSEEHLATNCLEENEPVVALANHIADAYALHLELIRSALADEDAPAAMRDAGALDVHHAEHSQRFRQFKVEQTIQHLQENGQALSQYVAGLSKEELHHKVTTPLVVKWFERPINVDQLIEFLVIGHPYTHLHSIRETIEPS